MIIFGTKGVTSTIKEGSFNCPQCNDNQKYKHLKVRKFFTLYFIPLIPLENLGDYVECRKCRGTFIPKVLEQGSSRDEFMAFYEQALRFCLIKMMLADGIIEENEKNVVLEIINKFGNIDLTFDELDALIEKIKHDKNDINFYLKQICNSLNEHGKETIIKCALHVACADGNFDESEKQLIIEMANSLEMSSSHLKGIFSEMFERNSID